MVVAIIALLIAILLPALGKAKETVRRTTCATNLRAQAQSCAIYASQFNDTLPQFNLAGVNLNWFWDETAQFSEALLAGLPNSHTNMTDPNSLRKLFYCPSNTDQNTMMVNGVDLWHYPNPPGTSSVLGYGWLNDRGQGGLRASSGLGQTLAAQRLNPPLGFESRMINVKWASQRELIFDAIISPNTNPSLQDWTNVKGGFPNPHKTSHMGGNGPAGQNVAAFDNSVTWRKWKGSSPQNNGTTAGVVTPMNCGPIFWVINP